MDTTQLNATMLKVMVLTSGLIGVSGQLRMKPDNVAAVVGTDVVLQCQGPTDDPNASITWYEYIQNESRKNTISNKGTIIVANPNHGLYSISGDPSTAQFHLNINLTIVSGGRYECYELLGPFEALAHITVLQSAPVCSTTIQEDGVVEEDETITYTCEVNYNSTSIDWPPVMTWTMPNGTITEVNKLSISGGTVISSVNVTGAPGLNGAVYSVQTHFETYRGSLPADHATNTPTYSHSHSFNALLVHYSPRYITFQPDGNTFNPGDRLTCSAVGNPAVSFKWYNSTDNSTLADGAVLTIREEMDGLTCGCEAYNTIRGTNHTLSKEITLTVTKAPTTTPTTTTSSIPATSSQGPTADKSDPSTAGLSGGAVIGIAVGASLAALIIIAAVIYCCCCLDRKETPPTTPKNVPPVTMSKIHGDQVRMQADNGQALGPEAAYPQDPPPGYQTWDKSTPRGSYDQNLPPPDRQNPSAEGVVYADLALDDTPRSRKPIQVFENTDYAEIQRV